MSKTDFSERNDPMTEQDNRLPPALLFRSFLLVAGAYMLNLVVLGIVAVAVLRFAFPESFEILNLEPEKFNSVFEENPDKVFPPEFLWLLLVISSLICFALGYLVARQAPIAKFPHAIFFAAILFVQYLQLAIGATNTLQRMFVLFMAASPIAAVIGANLHLRRQATRQSDEP